jgi:GAF domain-containing protein
MTARNDRIRVPGRCSSLRATVNEPPANGLHPTLAIQTGRSRAQDPLTALLHVTDVVAAEVNLGQTLRRLVDSARELLGVSYAAIALSGRHDVLEEFAHAGIDAQTLTRLGPGSAIIEWLSERPHSLEHAVSLRGRQLVTLYVAENAGNAGNAVARFTPNVERLAAGFAEAAGTAIDNARLYQLASQSQRWAQAAADLTQELASHSSQAPLEVVLRHAVRAAQADLAAVMVPENETSIRLHSIIGGMDGLPSGMLFPRENSPAADVMRTGKALLLERPTALVHEVSDEAMGPIAVVPLTADRTVLGALVVSRKVDRSPFTTTDVESLSRFTSYAGIALELDRALADREQLRLHDDRARIAAELHAHVVRQLFTIGMGLAGIIESLDDAELRRRVEGYVTALDDSIRAIRETIYHVRDE